MRLETRINEDLKTAMKAKNQGALRALRAIKSAILLANTDGSGKELDAAAEIKLLQKLVKQRRDSLDIFEKQGREDLASVEREEIEVITTYLPEQMGEEQIAKIVSTVIEETGASSMKDMGRVMGVVSQKLAGKADGKVIAGIVKAQLAG